MASGNLGDLWFQLGIKDNSHKALNSMLKDVQRLEGMINSLNLSINKEQDPKKKKEMKEQLSNALNYLHLLQKVNIELNKISGIKNINAGINTGELDRAKKALMDFRNELINLQAGKTAGGVDNAFMSAYNAKFRNLITDVRQIEKAFDKENTLSASKNNAARLNRELETTKNKLAEIQSLQSRGIRNGIDTTALLSGGNTLRGVKRRMETMLADDNLLANGAKVKSLLSDIAFAYTKATGKVQEYKRTASDTASVESAFSKQKLAVEQINTILGNIDKLKGKSLEIGTDTSKLTAVRGEIERIKTTIESFSGKQLLNKGFGDALNELQLWKERVNRTLKDQSGANQSAKATDRNLETMEARYRRLQEIISEVNRKIRELNDSARQGFKVGADTSRAEIAISRLTEMRDKFNNADIGSKNAVAELVSEYKILKNEIGNAKSEQDKLNNAITRANKKQDRKNERQEARDNKQRLSEIKATEARYDSLGNKVRALRREFSRGISLGADVSKAEAEISRLLSLMRNLRTIKDRLNSENWREGLGMLGNIGSGHDTTLASRILQDQKAINQEVQRGIELEQKRQQEIAQSAAKARNDLAAAFAGANAEAKKMQSIVGDIKSLFLQGGIVFGAQQFFNSIVKTGGEIVQQHVALRSILGDVQKADELFAQTQQLALQSPFKFGELNRDVKQLAAFGVEANDLYDTTKRLADIASGLGVDFGRLGLAFGQVKARSWLDGKELRQFAYAGLPLLQKITELYNAEGKNGRKNYTQADVKKMISGRKVSFEDVQKVLWKMTDEGGQFYNMQLVLSETLLGRWNKLIDAWDIMLGRFAEGKNVVGGTFSFIINRVTELVLALDKLSPALLSFGAVFAVRKLGGMAYSKMGIGSLANSYTQQMNAQLKSYAIEQQQLVVEGKITQKIAQQNVFKRAAILSEKQSLVASYNRAALEGRMSVLQMQRAVKEGLVSKEIIRQLALMGQITAKQEQIILNGGRMSAVWSMTTSKIGGFFNAIGGWWGIGITAITSLLMGYYQWSSRVKEEEKSLIEGAKQKSKKYEDFLSGLGPKDSSNLSLQVDSMKEILKSSDDYTDSIKQQVESAGSLSKQYDILKEKIEDAKKANDGLADKYGVITNNATSATGLVSDNLFDMIGADTPQWLQWLNGLTNDDIAKNVEQAQESLSKFQVMFDELDSSTKAKMEDFIRSLMENNEDLSNQIKGLPLTEQIRMLAAIGGDDWEKFVDKFANGSKETEKWLKELAERAKDSSDDVSEIMYDDVPRGLESVRKQLGLSQDQFRTWAKRNPEIFASMMDKMAQKANITSKTILYYFHSAISKLMDMDFWPGDSGNGKKGKPSYNSGVNTPFSEIIRQRLHKNGTFTGNKKKGKFWTREVDNALRQVQDQSFETTGENIRKELKSARNELDTIVNGKVSKNSSEYKNAKHKYDLWKAIADAGYISDDLGKNKVTGNFGKGKNKNGREEDTELKRLQERLSSLKSARQMYQKYKSIMSDEEAKKKTYNLFPEVTGLNLEDYQKAVHSLIEGFSINTTERKKFQTSIYREVAEWLFDEKDKKEYERKAADFTELLNRLSSQWDLYKELFSKTGDKNFSSSAFSNPGYIDEKAKELIVEYNNKFGKDFQRENAMSMSDGVAKETLKGPGEYEAWKKIVDLLRNNYIKILQDAADIIAQTASTQEKIAAIYAKYETPIAQAKEAGDNGLAYRYTRQRDKEVNSAKTEAFNKSSDYITFFGAVSQLGMGRASEIASQIRENINQALADGTIDAREYGKQIQQLDEQLKKLSSGKKNFFNAGLSGVAEQRVQNANEKITAGAALKQEGERLAQEATTRLLDALKNSDWDGVAKAAAEVQEGKKKAKEGENKIKEGQEEAKAANKFKKAMSAVSVAADKINANIQGVVAAFNDIKDTASALGVDTESNAWQNATAFFDSLNGISNSISSIATSAMSGNVGGVIHGVVGIFTSPFKAFAAAHDAKQERQIKLAERSITELERLRNDVKTTIENTLGGVYSYEMDKDTKATLKKVTDNYEKGLKLQKSGVLIGYNGPYTSDTYNAAKKSLAEPDNAFLAEQASLMAQKDEMQRQLNAEQGKKKKDKDKIADYKQEIKEMETTIKQLATDFLKDIYGVDMKSWASQLTDAVVSAWEKGEDAIDAYKKKAREMVKDLTKNILSQKIMEKALEGPLEALTTTIKQKGRLEPEDVVNVADELYKQTDDAVYNITAILESLKNRGLDLSATGDGSVTNGIKNITEETADILASYVNAIRLDVSVNRAQVKDIGELLKMRLPEMGQIQKAQLGQLTQIVMLAEARNEKLDRMMDWMTAVSTSGRKKLYIS